MYAQYALLVPAAFVVIYIAICAGGALIGMVSLAAQLLRAVRGRRSTKARAAALRPPVQPTRPREGAAIQPFTVPATAC